MAGIVHSIEESVQGRALARQRRDFRPGRRGLPALQHRLPPRHAATGTGKAGSSYNTIMWGRALLAPTRLSCKKTAPENAMLRQVGGQPMAAPLHIQ